MTTNLSRRRLLGAALAAGVVLPIGAGSRAWAAPARMTLPPPAGPYRVGTVSLHLVDTARPDPVAGPGHYRELMTSVWYPAGAACVMISEVDSTRRCPPRSYPATNVARYPRARWMPPAPLRGLLASVGFDTDAVTAPFTAGHEGAPVRRTPGRLPVIVYSHGAHDHRSDATIVVQELASHGFVVVTVDHTYDAFSEFPDGRLTAPVAGLPLTPWDYVRDIRFVLDRIEDLAAGVDPDVEHRRLPDGLSAALDLRRIGMFGWSKGATATALVMQEDRRVRAGLSFDGPMQSQPMLSTELDRPFMLMTAEFTRAAESSVADFWSLLRGWRLNVQAVGAVHSSYCDHQWLIPQLAKAVGMSDEELQGWIGTLDPARAVRIQQAYPLAFFDVHLRGRRGRLLDGLSPAFPEVKFIP